MRGCFGERAGHIEINYRYIEKVWGVSYLIYLIFLVKQVKSDVGKSRKDCVATLSKNNESLACLMEKAMAPHSSTLAWKIPWMEEPGRLQSMGSWRVWHNWATSLSRIGEGNGNPLQCSCLENPRDRGAWWAAVYGVAQSGTRLKWLSSSSSMFKGNNQGHPDFCSTQSALYYLHCILKSISYTFLV